MKASINKEQVMTRKSNVVQIFKPLLEREKDVQWEMTPKRKIAMERNWCFRILACIEALCEGPLARYGASMATRNSLLRAIRDVRFSIDHAYYQKLQKLESKGKK